MDMTPHEFKVAAASLDYLTARANAARTAVGSIEGKVARSEADVEAARVALAETIAEAERCEADAAAQVVVVSDAVVVDPEEASMVADTGAAAFGATVLIVENEG